MLTCLKNVWKNDPYLSLSRPTKPLSLSLSLHSHSTHTHTRTSLSLTHTHSHGATASFRSSRAAARGLSDRWNTSAYTGNVAYSLFGFIPTVVYPLFQCDFRQVSAFLRAGPLRQKHIFEFGYYCVSAQMTERRTTGRRCSPSRACTATVG